MKRGRGGAKGLHAAPRVCRFLSVKTPSSLVVAKHSRRRRSLGRREASQEVERPEERRRRHDSHAGEEDLLEQPLFRVCLVWAFFGVFGAVACARVAACRDEAASRRASPPLLLARPPSSPSKQPPSPGEAHACSSAHPKRGALADSEALADRGDAAVKGRRERERERQAQRPAFVSFVCGGGGGRCK